MASIKIDVETARSMVDAIERCEELLNHKRVDNKEDVVLSVLATLKRDLRPLQLTVGELIAELQKRPEDQKVYLEGCDCWRKAFSVTGDSIKEENIKKGTFTLIESF